MIRHVFALCATIELAIGPSTRLARVPDACQLLNQQDASTLAGVPVTVPRHNAAFVCAYRGAGGPAANGVEITWREYPDAGAAHAAFPRWVLPVAGPTPGLTTTPAPGIGDEATVMRNPITSGIYFRRGAVLVKIGTHPPAADAALKAAAGTALSRL
jgi:hypothetical protein